VSNRPFQLRREGRLRVLRSLLDRLKGTITKACFCEDDHAFLLNEVFASSVVNGSSLLSLYRVPVPKSFAAAAADSLPTGESGVDFSCRFSY
jgi:hypothetical protein